MSVTTSTATLEDMQAAQENLRRNSDMRELLVEVAAAGAATAFALAAAPQTVFLLTLDPEGYTRGIGERIVDQLINHPLDAS